MTTSALKSGDFTGLATNYSLHRPGYSETVLDALLGALAKPESEIDFVDVGAGTGIWTRMVCDRGLRSVVAVEPNDDMRNTGQVDSLSTGIQWRNGTGEKTGLDDACCDWLTMASSFHWVDFDRGISEFARVIRDGGRFTALWNPRLLENNPLLMEIENKLQKLNPAIERKSSGRSGITETLNERLWATPYFDDVIYVEGRHVISMSAERYIGAWRSVNDVRVQLGDATFEQFLEWVSQRIGGIATIEATYLTRAWSARRIASVRLSARLDP